MGTENGRTNYGLMGFTQDILINTFAEETLGFVPSENVYSGRLDDTMREYNGKVVRTALRA